jgi:HEAT repeats
LTDSRKAPPVFTMLLATLAFVLVPFLFWYLTWFGRKLSDADLEKYLTDTSAPHQTQHAIAQLADMMARHDLAAPRWHPALLALARNQESEFRLMAAWAMGQDAKSDDLHQALLTLLRDPEPVVRWNAALALIRFGDASGEPELHLMLRPYRLPASTTGSITLRAKAQDAFASGTVVARIKDENGNDQDVRSPMSGALERWIARDGAHVVRGDAIAVLAPGADQVWEALRALVLVGQPADLEDVERFARGAPGMNERTRQQAELTAKAIRGRMVKSE